MKKYSFLILLVLLFPGCRFFKGDPYKNTTTTGETAICADETFKPVVEAEIDVFKAIYGYATVNAKFVPENNAVDLLLKDSVQLAIISRELKKDEVAFLNQKKLYPRQTKVAVDAIALIVNPSSKDTLITLDQIRDILTGKISKWNQLNPSSPADPIRVVFDNQQSGIVQYMNDSICKGKMVTSNVFAMEFNRDVIDYTATHPGVLGFIGASWITNANDSSHLSFHKRIKVMGVSSEQKPALSDYYKPYQAYMVDNIYPLTREIYLINTEPRNGLATGFSAFMASDKGQRIILKSGILPAVAPTRVVNIRKDI
jgi:phosphate transport system substrate-binding protein